MEITQELLDQLNANGVYETLGIRIEEAHGGKAHSHLRPQPNLCWPFPGQPHGGVLFTLMDATMAWAVLYQMEPGQNCATIKARTSSIPTQQKGIASPVLHGRPTEQVAWVLCVQKSLIQKVSLLLWDRPRSESLNWTW
jgi:uncharacterized protein (TIGR00369 family)